MTDKNVCLNCKRGEEQVPVTHWRYQGREFVICADCLPPLLHHRDKVLANWPPEDEE